MAYSYGYNSRDDRCPLCNNYLGKDEVKKLMEREPEPEILGSKLFLDKEFVDLKIICKGKTFECHKNVLSCQSDVFKTMFLNMNTDEAKSGQVKIKDITGKFKKRFYIMIHDSLAIHDLVYFLYLYAKHKYSGGRN